MVFTFNWSTVPKRSLRLDLLTPKIVKHERPIFLVTDDYHRTIIINPTALDYICVPAHKFREGEMEEAEIELNDA